MNTQDNLLSIVAEKVADRDRLSFLPTQVGKWYILFEFTCMHMTRDNFFLELT
jgi:hypothetical protein